MRVRLTGMTGFGIQLTGLLKPFDGVFTPAGLFVGVGYLDTGLRSRVLVCPCLMICLLYTSPSPRDRQKSRMPSSA